MKIITKKQNGFTLIELLASITILMIVLITFLSVFSQSAKYTKMNEDDLVAINLARQVLEEVKSKNDVFVELKGKEITTFEGNKNLKSINANGIFDGNANLRVQLSISEPTTNITTETSLIQVDVQIFDVSRATMVTNTYGYLTKKVNNP